MSSLNNFLSSHAASTSDHLIIQSLLSRLDLSQNLDDFLLNSESDEDDDSDLETTTEEKHRKLIAKEESKLEKEIIKIVNSGKGYETLKPNSGQSVSVLEHNICVGVHEEKGSEYRVWEWHGHVMFFDEDDGYNAEYVYGNYFEKVVEKKKRDEENESKVKGEGNSGLRDLIGSVNGLGGVGIGRVVHRNSITLGSGSSAQ